jgi:hypothetical protein
MEVDPMLGLKQRDPIADLKSRRQMLAGRLQTVEQEIERLTTKRGEVLTGGDDAQLDEVNAAITRGHATADQLQQSVVALDEKIGAAEQAVRDEEDRVSRERFCVWADDKISEIDRAVSAFQAAAETLGGTLRATSTSGAHCASMISGYVSQISDAIAATRVELTTYRGGVADGSRCIPDARAKPPPAAAETPDIERLSIYAMKHLRWREPDGTIKVIAKYGVAALPTAIGQAAIASNLADLSTSHRARELMKAFSQPLWPPSADDPSVVDLDQLLAAEAEQQEAVA